MAKVLITDKIDKIAQDILKEAEGIEVVYMDTLPEDELANVIGDYDALMIRSQTKVTPKIIEAAKNMKVIGRAGVGVDNVNLEAATKAGIIVINSPDGNTTAAAEHTVALMLSLSRHIPTADKTVKEGKWERSKLTGTEVFNKTLGIIGLGKIGSRVAKGALGLGMKVIVYDPFTSKDVIEEIGATQIENLDDLFINADYITVHVPKNKDTVDLINKESIAKMKNGVKIINCARGGIVNEQDLKDALESGKVSAAAIDVYTQEPIVAENPLLSCKGDIILTPHLGASTCEAQVNVAIDVAEQIRDIFNGETARSAVNIPSLKAEKLEPVKEYMNIAENLGLLARQIAEGSIKKVEVATKGTLGVVDISPLRIAILKGILSRTTEGVNFVNAPIIAQAKGIEVVESKTEQACSFSGLITVKVETEKGSKEVAGGILADGTSRIFKINEYNTSLAPDEHILIAPHTNKPGMVAAVASVLGERNINISMMQVAKKDKSQNGESIMIINTDSVVEAEALNKIKEIDGIYNALYVNLAP